MKKQEELPKKVIKQFRDILDKALEKPDTSNPIVQYKLYSKYDIGDQAVYFSSDKNPIIIIKCIAFIEERLYLLTKPLHSTLSIPTMYHYETKRILKKMIGPLNDFYTNIPFQDLEHFSIIESFRQDYEEILKMNLIDLDSLDKLILESNTVIDYRNYELEDQK